MSRERRPFPGATRSSVCQVPPGRSGVSPRHGGLPGCIDQQSMLADTEEELETAVADHEVTAELP